MKPDIHITNSTKWKIVFIYVMRKSVHNSCKTMFSTSGLNYTVQAVVHQMKETVYNVNGGKDRKATTNK